MSSKYGVEAHTVDEQMRINFTKKLLQLREDNVNEVVFSSTLTNIERKFLHKLSEELGLQSKSHGSGSNRQITVTKRADGELRESGPALFQMSKRAFDLLTAAFSTHKMALNDSELQPMGSFCRNVEILAQTNSAEADRDLIRMTHRKVQEERDQKTNYQTMLQKRMSLPAYHHRFAVCSLVKENQIVLVSGETGCGKTTQVPQFLLDDPDIGPSCRIVVTQPRRLSAISVAERIATERCEAIGRTIGYNIRLESEKSRSTQVLFVTPGVLLRKLQNDPKLEEFTHIIIDEAHERDRFTEFLMIVLKFICAQRSELKLILMSATMQTSKLSSYFGGVPQIHMGGSVFPVQEFFLEHVLRFTDYMACLPTVPAGQKMNALSAYLRRSQEYNCSSCGSGPFKSPEELGTHCALCTGEAPKHSNRAEVGNTTRAGDRPKHSSAEELVRMLAAAVNASGNAKNAVSASAALRGACPQPQVAATASSSDGAAANRKKKGPLKPAIQTGEESSAISGVAASSGEDVDEDVFEGQDGLGGDDGAIADFGEDEDGGGGLGGVAAAVGSVEVDKEGANVIDDTGDASDALLKQYQYLFDDAQVDYDLILALLQYLCKSEFCKEGSVLVFMPGWDDISRMYRILSNTPQFMDTKKYKVIQLHSGIPRRAQDQVFEPLQPGEHKIILSTNIAETSITIDDVAVVVDTGRVKEKVYDPHVKLAYLKSTWISQASARQRKGRAGRTRAGVCFHLFSRRRHSSLPEFQDSELLRMPLEELVLQTKQLGLAPGQGDAPDSVYSFLQRALDPPHPLSISNAISLLKSINCLDEMERVTPVGRAVSRLPLDPRIGRVILLACICGCGPAVLSTSAAMAYRDPFIMPANEQQRAISNASKAHLAQGFPSDQVALLKALEGYNMLFQRFNAGRAGQFCDENYLSRSVMSYLRDVVQQLSQILVEVGVSPVQAFNLRNNGNVPLLMALIGIGLYPDVGVRRRGATAFMTEKGRKARIHPSSVNNRSAYYKSVCKEQLEIIGYQDLVSSVTNNAPGSANLLMLNTTPLSMFALLLTCGTIKEIRPKQESNSSSADNDSGDEEENATPSSPDEKIIEVDEWLRLKTTSQALEIVQSCRQILAKAMEKFLANPAAVLPISLAKCVEAIVQALTLEQSATSSECTVPLSVTKEAGKVAKKIGDAPTLKTSRVAK